MILDKADELGMVPIVSLFYSRQDQLLRDDTAVAHGVTSAVAWLLTQGYENVLVEVANQCDEEGYDHGIIRASRVHELIAHAHSQQIGGRRLYVGVSFTGGTTPTPDVLRSSDFVLLHGNNIDDPKGVSAMVERVRRTEGYRSMPILFNEDPHQDFDRPSNNFSEALSQYASWGSYEQGTGNYQDGFQSLPVNWDISSQRKRQFFRLLQEITGS